MVAAPARDGTDTAGPPAAFSADFGPGTFVPHACFAWMPRLTDTELRLLLAVVRQTIGWRKQRDWLSLRRLAALTGRGHAALSGALDGLVRKRLVEVLGTDGRALDTPQGRRAAGRLWLAPGPRLRPAEGATVKDGPPGDLTTLARDVFGADGAESGSDRQKSRVECSAGATPGEESGLGRRIHAPASTENGVQKVDTTKETHYKILGTRTVAANPPRKKTRAGRGSHRAPPRPSRHRHRRSLRPPGS